MQIEWVPTNSLVPNAKNRNFHPKEQIERLAKIIKANGWRHPIIVSKLSGQVVVGHGRLEAAKLLSEPKVPVHFQDFANEMEEFQFGVADNAIASWAELDLSGINADLPQFGPELDINLLGIKDFEIEPADKYGDKDADEVPAVKDTNIKVGDLFALGSHRLLCGDSTQRDSVERLMNGEKADMVFTDPPYGINAVKPDGNIGGNRVGKNGYGDKGQYDKKAKCGVYRPIIGDDKPFNPKPLLEHAPLQIIWGANHFSHELPTSPHWIVWNKEMPSGTDFSGAELAWTNIDKRAVKVYKFTWAGMTRQGDRKDELTKRVHPTQKPVGLFEMILNDYAPDSVIDLYLGSGSTLIACEKTNRKCYGMEIDPQYVQVVIDRWEKFTGQKATKISTGAA